MNRPADEILCLLLVVRGSFEKARSRELYVSETMHKAGTRTDARRSRPAPVSKSGAPLNLPAFNHAPTFVTALSSLRYSMSVEVT